MMKERITKNGIDYVLVGDYCIPDLKLTIFYKKILIVTSKVI